MWATSPLWKKCKSLKIDLGRGLPPNLGNSQTKTCEQIQVLLLQLQSFKIIYIFMVRMVRTCLFLIDDALRFEYVRNILAVMPPLCLPWRCRNVSVGRLLVWPDFALLESLLVSTRPAPCSPLTPSDRSRSSAPEPEISCRASSGRAREAAPSRRTQLPPVNTRSSQRHQLGTLRCRDGSSRLFSAWNYFSPRTPGFPIVRCDNLVKTWQRFARWQKKIV